MITCPKPALNSYPKSANASPLSHPESWPRRRKPTPANVDKPDNRSNDPNASPGFRVTTHPRRSTQSSEFSDTVITLCTPVKGPKSRTHPLAQLVMHPSSRRRCPLSSRPEPAWMMTVYFLHHTRENSALWTWVSFSSTVFLSASFRRNVQTTGAATSPRLSRTANSDAAIKHSIRPVFFVVFT